MLAASSLLHSFGAELWTLKFADEIHILGDRVLAEVYFCFSMISKRKYLETVWGLGFISVFRVGVGRVCAECKDVKHGF
uniref:Uncharacterized protein n=1 Tax=Physcomitrium patens TaxID=3218 RepID=A0A2K1JR61_PHYPA|nr:hypothetical protein PHYPA_016404 [Physcomitrium patens]